MMSVLYELTQVQKYYDGKKVLDIDTLSINQNEITGFFGPNGSGKSTLFSLLSFVDKSTSGEIKFFGKNVHHLQSKQHKDVILVPQNPYLLKRTVFENIVYGLKIRNETSHLSEKVFEALNGVGLENSFAQRKWSQLSGGEAQRVALAARLILKPKVLILDEPTTGVDTSSAQLIKEAILTAKQKWNTTILIASHDHKWLNQICDTRIALFQGSLVESGSVNLLFAPWEKDENRNLVKRFLDGQELVIENSHTQKRDSVVMIDSSAIDLSKYEDGTKTGIKLLVGIINSLSKQPAYEGFYVEFCIAGVHLNCRISTQDMDRERFLPGDQVYVSIDTSRVRWWTL